MENCRYRSIVPPENRLDRDCFQGDFQARGVLFQPFGFEKRNVGFVYGQDVMA